MTTFPLELVIESSLCLLVLLGVYKLCLEQQPMHRLKRAYLLGTLLLSFAGPLVSVQMPSDWVPFLASKKLVNKQLFGVSAKDETANVDLPLVRANVPAPNVPDPAEPTPYWLWLYGSITALMLVRFTRNLYVLARQVWTNPTEPFYGAILVKLRGTSLPYTFLHYLFVPTDAFDRGEIEDELFTHEMGHIQQRHSLDVLLVEIVLCFSWFNPLVFWLKRAIQCNHEFLADQAVNETYQNVPRYQHLLFSKLTEPSPKLSLISTLTFQTTKQRLLMMTKQTSTARTWLAGFTTALLFSTLTVILTGKAPAQQIPAAPAVKRDTDQSLPLTEKELLEKQLTVAEMERRFGNKPVNISREERRNGDKKEVLFKDLTPEQKTRVVYVAPDSRKTPTEAQWNAFKNPKKYGVWVDSKRRRDNPFSKYKRTDIVTYWYSFVHKNARQPEGYQYQLELYTEAGYQQTLKERRENPLLILATKEMLERRQQRQVGTAR